MQCGVAGRIGELVHVWQQRTQHASFHACCNGRSRSCVSQHRRNNAARVYKVQSCAAPPSCRHRTPRLQRLHRSKRARQRRQMGPRPRQPADPICPALWHMHACVYTTAESRAGPYRWGAAAALEATCLQPLPRAASPPALPPATGPPHARSAAHATLVARLSPEVGSLATRVSSLSPKRISTWTEATTRGRRHIGCDRTWLPPLPCADPTSTL